MSQVKTGNQVFTTPGDIAESFNNHYNYYISLHKVVVVVVVVVNHCTNIGQSQLTNGFVISTPTQQICKTVFENFSFIFCAD